jgi:hypothetical protein
MWLFTLIFVLLSSVHSSWASSSSAVKPEIRSLLKPAVYERVMKDRQIMTHASLDELPKPSSSKKYSYYACMLVHASVQKTHRILTDYQLYSKLIPYIDRAKYDPKTHLLDIQGGVLGWVLHSWVKFEERGDSAIHYSIVQGHFQGLSGDIYFESRAEKGTLVYMAGEQVQKDWPPKFILERGAEIVFGFTARRMRSYIESPDSGNTDVGSKKDERQKNDSTNTAVPQPTRSRL